jgi:hypothetical protein
MRRLSLKSRTCRLVAPNLAAEPAEYVLVRDEEMPHNLAASSKKPINVAKNIRPAWLFLVNCNMLP